MTPEALRASALEKLGPHADPRASEALERGELVLIPSGSAWEGARGRVTGVRVGLGLTPEDLARLAGAHAVRDALVAAVAAAVAAEGTLALTDLAPFWSPAARAEAALYRGALGPSDLGAALVQYLRATGEQDAADFADGAHFTVEGDDVRVDPPPPPKLLARLEAAVRTLLEGPVPRRVHLRRRAGARWV